MNTPTIYRWSTRHNVLIPDIPEKETFQDKKELPAFVLFSDWQAERDARLAAENAVWTRGKMIRELESKLQAERDRAEALGQKYHELIMAVASKFPDETRHQTALRYINERENRMMEPGCEKSAAASSTPAPKP